MTAAEQKQPRTRPRWLRYSLRSLLVLTLLISIGLAVYVWLFQELHQQQAIAAELTNRECMVEWEVTFHPQLLETTERVSTTPAWLIDLLGEDPHRQLNLVWFCYDDSEKLGPVLDAINRLPYLTSLLLQDNDRDGPVPIPVPRSLRRLQLVFAKPTTDSLIEIGDLPDLQSLTITSCELQDADFARLSGLQRLRVLGLLGNDDISSDCLPAIAQMSSLVQLDLGSAGITDANLELLQKLPELRKLNLDGNNISDVAAPKLARLSRLEELDLSMTKVSSDGLPALAEMASLVALDLSMTNVTDANLEALQRVPKLAKLNLERTGITDAAIPKLAELACLRDLDLSDTTIVSGAGLSAFAKCGIRHLNLSSTFVGDDCIDELIQCKELESLNVDFTRISPAGVGRLKQALPQTEIRGVIPYSNDGLYGSSFKVCL